MTHLPHPSRLVIDRPDLPEYELNHACPITGAEGGLENHHLWPRSFGTKSWWVELPDGEVVGNRIMLSSGAHYRVTINKARIVFENTVFYWEENGEREPLRWQPPTMHRRKAAESLMEREKEAERRQLESVRNTAGIGTYNNPRVNTANLAGAVKVNPVPGDVEPGHDCPTCRRRVPLPKKATSPDTKVFSTRVPVADVDTFKEILDAAAEHAGLKSKAHFAYWTILAGLTLILQAPREDLPNG